MMSIVFRKFSFPWLTAALAAVSLALAAGVTASAASANRVAPCNGSSGLCSRPFDRVTLPGSHNSMSAGELGWKNPNQTLSIPHQLERGARAMLIDVHYGRQVPLGITQVPKAEGAAAGDPLYLCHELCGWGATPLIPELRRIRAFFAGHRREVGLFVVQDAVEPDDFAAAVEESGLIDFVYRGPTTDPGGWPTLGEMIRTDQRIVFLAEQDAGSVPWYHLAYSGTMQETPYTWPRPTNPHNYTGVQFLTDPAALGSSCVTNRGGSTGPLFLMNHWVSGDGIPGSTNSIVPQRALAETVNAKAALVARARACEAERGLKPTILAVDFFGTGDVVGAARELNGVEAAPFLDFRQRPKRAVVRAGRRAVYRMKLNNLGDAAGKARVCAKPPKRLAVRPRCVKVPVAVGAVKALRIGLKTRTRAKGNGKVRFTVAGAGARLSARAPLRVKPKPRPRKRHRR